MIVYIIIQSIGGKYNIKRKRVTKTHILGFNKRGHSTQKKKNYLKL